MSECKHEEILEQLADELTQLSPADFLKVIGLLRLCADKAGKLRQENADLRQQVWDLEKKYEVARLWEKTAKDTALHLRDAEQQAAACQEALGNAIKVISELALAGDEYGVEQYASAEVNKLQALLNSFSSSALAGTTAAHAAHCVTHYHACDCREHRFQQIEQAVSRLLDEAKRIWLMNQENGVELPRLKQAIDALTALGEEKS